MLMLVIVMMMMMMMMMMVIVMMMTTMFNVINSTLVIAMTIMISTMVVRTC